MHTKAYALVQTAVGMAQRMKGKSVMRPQSTRVLCVCQNPACGKEFYVVPSNSDAKYCSRKCHDDYEHFRSSTRTEKQCSRCKEIKPLDAFALHRKSVDGHQGICRGCGPAQAKEFRTKNKNHNNAYQRERYLQNIERKREDARRYYYKYRQDPEKLRKQRIRKLDAIHRRDAKMNGPADPETLEYMEILMQDPCSYCGKYPAGTIDHIVPLDEHGLHHWSNLTAACEMCNKSKRTKSLWQYLLFRRKMRIRDKWII